MDGTETHDEYDRCRLFDVLFQMGPQTRRSLADFYGMPHSRVTHLTNHEWFSCSYGVVGIVRERGPFKGLDR